MHLIAVRLGNIAHNFKGKRHSKFYRDNNNNRDKNLTFPCAMCGDYARVVMVAVSLAMGAGSHQEQGAAG